MAVVFVWLKIDGKVDLDLRVHDLDPDRVVALNRGMYNYKFIFSLRDAEFEIKNLWWVRAYS